MKKLIYLLTVTALGISACNSGNKGYTISGTIEGAADGDTVFLQERSDREFNKIDTAIISKGAFSFEGSQDSTVNRYITYRITSYNVCYTKLLRFNHHHETHLVTQRNQLGSRHVVSRTNGIAAHLFKSYNFV